MAPLISGTGLTKINKSIAFSRKLIPFASNINKFDDYRERLWIHWNRQRKRCQAIQFISYMKRKLMKKIYIYFRTRIKRIKHLFQLKKWNNVTPVPVISK